MPSPSSATDRAPELHATRWFNTPRPLALGDLRGRVVVLMAFQMLCPGCVARSIPLAQRIHQTFDGRDVAVVPSRQHPWPHHQGPNGRSATISPPRLATRA